MLVPDILSSAAGVRLPYFFLDGDELFRDLDCPTWSGSNAVSALPLLVRDGCERFQGGEFPSPRSGEGRGVRSDIAARAGELTAEPAGENELAMLDVDHTFLKWGIETLLDGSSTLAPATAGVSTRGSEIVGGALINGNVDDMRDD